MRTNVTTLFAGIIALGTLGACSTTSQITGTDPIANDPMYAQFRPSTQLEKVELNDKVTADYEKGQYAYQEQSLSSKTVNPDLVAEYQNDGQQASPEGGNDEYYVEDFNRPGAYGNQPQVVNNY